jgi:hypothetical protein
MTTLIGEARGSLSEPAPAAERRERHAERVPSRVGEVFWICE